MYPQAVLLSVLVAITEARFGQEQVPIPAIQALGAFGSSGQAATLAGSSISTLLAASNPCAKLTQADLIVSELGTDPQVISAARGLVAAEQNFNPFVVNVPNICDDPTLPTTAALRGVVPLVDPAVGGSALENSNSVTSKTTPFANAGLSVAQIMANNGFSNFTTEAVDGTKGSSPASGASASVAASVVTPPSTSASASTSSAAVLNCAGLTTLVTVTKASSSSSTLASVATVASSTVTGTGVPAGSDGTAGVAPGLIKSTIAGLDFGLCTPTMKFEPGLDGRSDTEFTFQAQDPLINKGQEEALNPNIISNKICDQLTNVCEANEAAKQACATAKSQMLASGTKDASTADTWNTALGFAGTNLNPDNAPQAGLIGHD